jgi:hypothetical protein
MHFSKREREGSDREDSEKKGELGLGISLRMVKIEGERERWLVAKRVDR